MSKLIFIGGGGHFKVAYNISLKTPKIQILGVYDDRDLSNLLPPKVKYLGNLEKMIKDEIDALYFISIGDNSLRKKIFTEVSHHPFFQYRFNINLIHHESIIPDSMLFTKVGYNNLICAGVVIEPEVKLGNFNIINTNSSINHDCTIGDFNHLAPNTTLCGHVSIKNGSFIGAGSTIIPKIKVGSKSIIGSQSNVIRDISDNSLAYGNPCKIIKKIL